jgi:peptidoglycan lytic transglycosylase
MMMRLAAALCGVLMLLAVSPVAKAQSGIASVYAHSGGRTASGEPVAAGALTAAHRTLPFGSFVRVTNRRNGRSVVVRISDRGPFVRGRIIDLSPAAARALGFSGLAPVTVDATNG